MKNDKMYVYIIDHRLFVRQHCLRMSAIILCLSVLFFSSALASSSTDSTRHASNIETKSSSKISEWSKSHSSGLPSSSLSSPSSIYPGIPSNELITADSIYPCLDTFDIVLLSKHNNLTENPFASRQHGNNSRSLVRVYWATDDVVRNIQFAAERHSINRRLFPHNRKRMKSFKQHIHRPSMLLEMRKLNYVREYLFDDNNKLLRIDCDLFEALEHIQYCFVYVYIFDGLIIYESLPHCVPTTLSLEPNDINYQNDRTNAADDKSVLSPNYPNTKADNDVNLEDVRSQILPPGPAYSFLDPSEQYSDNSMVTKTAHCQCTNSKSNRANHETESFHEQSVEMSLSESDNIVVHLLIDSCDINEHLKHTKSHRKKIHKIKMLKSNHSSAALNQTEPQITKIFEPSTICIVSLDSAGQFTVSLEAIEPGNGQVQADKNWQRHVNFNSTVDGFEMLKANLIIRNGPSAIDPQIRVHDNPPQTDLEQFVSSNNLRIEVPSSPLNLTLRFRRAINTPSTRRQTEMLSESSDEFKSDKHYAGPNLASINENRSISRYWTELTDSFRSVLDRTSSYLAFSIWSETQNQNHRVEANLSHTTLTPFHLTAILLGLFILSTLVIYVVIACNGYRRFDQIPLESRMAVCADSVFHESVPVTPEFAPESSSVLVGSPSATGPTTPTTSARFSAPFDFRTLPTNSSRKMKNSGTVRNSTHQPEMTGFASVRVDQLQNERIQNSTFSTLPIQRTPQLATLARLSFTKPPILLSTFTPEVANSVARV